VALVILSLFLNVASAVSLSLGILTPELIRRGGQRLAKYIFSKPAGTFFSAAHSKIFPTDPAEDWRALSNRDWQALLNRCLIELVVELLTIMIASFMTFLLLLSVSIWGLVNAAISARSHRIELGLSIIGLLLCASGVCDFLQLFLHEGHNTSLHNHIGIHIESDTATKKLARRALHYASRPLVYGVPTSLAIT
jgi:hypothetical protein